MGQQLAGGQGAAMAHCGGDGPVAVYQLAFAPQRPRLQRDGTDKVDLDPSVV
ncbi:MAG TPA: hypothetical protein VKF14_18900 [Candidatus Dormibacteraeota bacterium]|nr:hypothetical protein [Candidatus Dormibacteraeota bacterium]